MRRDANVLRGLVEAGRGRGTRWWTRAYDSPPVSRPSRPRWRWYSARAGRSRGGTGRSRRCPARRCPRSPRVNAEYLNGGLPVRHVAELELDPHERSTSITSSRLRSMSSSEQASRFRRSSGSVFDSRTFRCQSSASIEMPSRCETQPRPGIADLLDLHRDVCDRHVQLAREEVRLAEQAEGARRGVRFEISSSMSRNRMTPESAW